MIDFISTKTILPSGKIPPAILQGERVPFNWQGLEFLPAENYSYRATNASLQAIGLGNMNAVFRNGMAATFHLSNSLHKVAHNGPNHTDYLFSELAQTVEYIADTLAIDFPNARLTGKFEFGVNLETGKPESFYLPSQTYRNLKSVPMLSNGKQYGGKFCLSSYGVKVYSPILKIALQCKGKTQNENKIARFEIASTAWYLRKKKIGLNLVKDLLNKRNLLKLGDVLTETAKQIKMIPMPPEGIDLHELEVWHFFNNATQEQLRQCRKIQKQSFYRHKRKFEKMLSQCQDISNYAPLVAEKWKKLLAA